MSWLTIMQLDRQLKEWQTLSQKYPRPKEGWVKTLRNALGMTAEQFANRLGLSRVRIMQLEHAEAHEAVSLRTLSEAADALNCKLVYVLVPKDDSLEAIIKARADELAENMVMKVAHSMSLEAQSVDKNILKAKKEELSKSLIQNINKKIWSERKKK